MFFGLGLAELQIYWWVIQSLLGGLLVFMFFVQGGQGLLFELTKNEEERVLLINSLGRKWELGFTTLVLFGGAAFAAFPLFYSVSFGGAYWVWLSILFCYILQAVSYEYRKKEGNLLGSKTYEVFLWINGVVGVFLIGVALSTLFSGANFILDSHNFVHWGGPYRGLESLLDPFNYLLAFALVFLSRILGAAYFINNITEETIEKRARRAIVVNTILFLPFFLGFLIWICLKSGFSVGPSSEILIQPYTYGKTFIEIPSILVVLVVGVVLVLLGILRAIFYRDKRAIFFLGVGATLATFAVLLNVGLGDSAFYPSLIDLQSSLTIANASSSYYTLSVMAYVSLLVPFVLAYIVYVWRAMDRVKITKEEFKDNHHAY